MSESESMSRSVTVTVTVTVSTCSAHMTAERFRRVRLGEYPYVDQKDSWLSLFRGMDIDTVSVTGRMFLTFSSENLVGCGFLSVQDSNNLEHADGNIALRDLSVSGRCSRDCNYSCFMCVTSVGIRLFSLFGFRVEI
jgi:hypothetical protein